MNRALAILISAWLAAAPAVRAAATAEALLTEAQRAEQAGSMQQAAKLYEQFLQQHADHSQVVFARYGLAKCYDAMGLAEESDAEYQKVLEGPPQFPNRRDAFYALGKSHGSNKRFDEGIEVFKQMLAEGAGLYEDEVLSLCSGYYAAAGKYDDAAGMLNRLKRRPGSPLAEQAAQKQAALFINAGKPQAAMDSLNDLIQLFPKCQDIPNLLGRVADLYLAQKQYVQAVQICNRIVEHYPKDPAAPQLMLRLGDVYRAEGQFDKAVALCEQVKTVYPKTLEAMTATFLLGLCHRDRQDYAKAAEAFDQIGQVKEYRSDPGRKGLAAEALLQSAELRLNELEDAPGAMERYADAAVLARESDSDRKAALLERCYFRLADDAYRKQQWGAALDYYTMLKAAGSQLDVLARILECNSHLNKLDNESLGRQLSDLDVSNLQARAAASAGTAAGLELELFLLDRKFAALPKSGLGPSNAMAAAGQYEALLTNYPPAVLSEQRNDAYIHYQAGLCYAAGSTNLDQPQARQALAAFDRAVQADPGESNPWRIPALESKAMLANRLGDTTSVARASLDLFAIAARQLDADGADPARQKKTIEYLKTLASRSDGNLVDEAIALCRKTIERHGAFSDLAREARFNLAQLYYQKRDTSAAAAAFKEFIGLYGPKQNAQGDFAEPWKPEPVDDKVEQVYAAALGIAHCWHAQGHTPNMLQAYQWMVRNVPYKNARLAEAQYWLTLDGVKGADRETPAGKIRLAEALWTNVVNSSLDFSAPKFKASYTPWIRTSPYARPAMLKSARFYSEAGQPEKAVQVLEQYQELFIKPRRDPGLGENDEAALYALGREYIRTREIAKMVALYQVYLNGLRESRLRVSALGLLAYHAGQQGLFPAASEAYAALLDEYGTNPLDGKGALVKVPAAERIRPGNTGWDGIRLPPPKDLDLGETRFALGFLYWKQRAWPACIQVLRPFDENSMLSGSRSRAKALSMLGQSHYQMANHTNCARVLTTLIAQYPQFEGLDDAYYYAARSYAELAAWPDLDRLYKRYLAAMGNAARRPRMDVLGARLAIAQGQVEKGRANLKSLAASDTSEEVRAEAYYQLGRECLARKPPQPKEAAGLFDQSLETFPSEHVCLAAAQARMELKEWPRALELLERAARDFPSGDPQVVAEARGLIPQVLKQLAQSRSTQ